MTVLASSRESDLYKALRQEISVVPRPVSAVLERVLREYRVDREEVVAAMWDLVEDDGLIYDASAHIRSRG